MSQVGLLQELVSSCLSTCVSSWDNSVPTGRIFMKFYIWVRFEMLSWKFKLHSNLTGLWVALHEDHVQLRSYLTAFFLEWEIFQTKDEEKMKQRIQCTLKFFQENWAIYDITWKNIVEGGRPHMTTRGMRIACWITKATDTHTECVIISAFLLQQRLHEYSTTSHFSLRACLTALSCRMCQSLLTSFWNVSVLYSVRIGI